MLNPVLAASALLLLVGAPAVSPATEFQDVQATRSARERVVIRVPQVQLTTSRLEIRRRTPVRAWAERPGGRCIAIDRISGATVDQPDAVDFILDNGARIRAHLSDDCPALGFYSGLYVKPTRDGALCADRDSIRTRAGRNCPVKSFATLVPIR